MRKVLWAIPLTAVAFAAGWAVQRVFGDVEPSVEIADHTYVAVVPGEVSSTRTLRATALWEILPAASNRAAGTVTSVEVGPGDSVEVGDVMFTVDEMPVVAAQGDVPAYRDIELGDRGRDVAQVQSMLAALGLYEGEVDGIFDAGLRRSVREWQEVLGVPASGVVRVGDIVFLPSLPSRVVLGPDAMVSGGILSGGEAAIGVLRESPAFFVDMASGQTEPIAVGQEVTLVATFGAETVSWTAVAGETTFGQSGLTMALHPTGGDPICGDQCHLIPIESGAALDAIVIQVPHTEGLVVPIGALVSTADGETAVVLESGELASVEVVAAARGLAVVVGVSEGTRVRVPAQS